MLDILKKLNEESDRGVLIGRNALNFHHDPSMNGEKMFRTDDFDFVCPNIKVANECRAILEAAGFTKINTTFTNGQGGEIDIVLADPQFPPNAVIGDYFNLPHLRSLWDARENRGGILIPNINDLIQNRLLYQRDNFGRDAEAIGLYFDAHPDRLGPMLNALNQHENAEERDKMLYALYEGVAEYEVLKNRVEQAMLADIERNNIHEKATGIEKGGEKQTTHEATREQETPVFQNERTHTMTATPIEEDNIRSMTNQQLLEFDNSQSTRDETPTQMRLGRIINNEFQARNRTAMMQRLRYLDITGEITKIYGGSKMFEFDPDTYSENETNKIIKNSPLDTRLVTSREAGQLKAIAVEYAAAFRYAAVAQTTNSLNFNAPPDEVERGSTMVATMQHYMASPQGRETALNYGIARAIAENPELVQNMLRAESERVPEQPKNPEEMRFRAISGANELEHIVGVDYAEYFANETRQMEKTRVDIREPRYADLPEVQELASAMNEAKDRFQGDVQQYREDATEDTANKITDFLTHSEVFNDYAEIHAFYQISIRNPELIQDAGNAITQRTREGTRNPNLTNRELLDAIAEAEQNIVRDYRYGPEKLEGLNAVLRERHNENLKTEIINAVGFAPGTERGAEAETVHRTIDDKNLASIPEVAQVAEIVKRYEQSYFDDITKHNNTILAGEINEMRDAVEITDAFAATPFGIVGEDSRAMERRDTLEAVSLAVENYLENDAQRDARTYAVTQIVISRPELVQAMNDAVDQNRMQTLNSITQEATERTRAGELARNAAQSEQTRTFIEGLSQNITRNIDEMNGILPNQTLPFNPATGKSYTGVNMLVLASENRPDNRWLTFSQINAAGGTVNKGEKGTKIQIWSRTEKGPDGETVKLDEPKLSYATVFNVAQTSLTDYQGKKPEQTMTPEQFIESSGAKIAFDENPAGHPRYDRASDTITLPMQNRFPDTASFQRVAIEQIVNRQETRHANEAPPTPGSPDAAMRDMKIKIAAAVIGDSLGIGHTADVHPGLYAQQWKRTAANHPRDIVKAAAAANTLAYTITNHAQQIANVRENDMHDEHNTPKHEPKPIQERINLSVPFAEKDAAKEAGCRWDREMKTWFAPPGTDANAIGQWRENRQLQATNPREELQNALLKFGITEMGNHPIMDGKPHRFSVQGDQPHEKSGYYKIYGDGVPAGFITNHRTKEESKWKASGYELTPEMKDTLARTTKEKYALREEEATKKQQSAAKRLEKSLAGMSPVTEKTPYMEAKGIGVESGIYLTAPDKNGQRKMAVPLMDITGKAWSLTTISDDGQKTYMKDAKKHGSFHVVGGLDALKDAPAIVIAEGYATAASLKNGLNTPVVAAMDAGNLLPVAQEMRKAFPDKAIVICGDDDRKLMENPQIGKNTGKEKAMEAALAVGGQAVFPMFPKGTDNQLSDFNDLVNKTPLGVEGLKQQAQPAIKRAINNQQAENSRTLIAETIRQKEQTQEKAAEKEQSQEKEQVKEKAQEKAQEKEQVKERPKQQRGGRGM